ncbi:MAG TPA: bacteriophage N4 adsorption protein A, partial [Ideonella sp.]|nr:bacteriophage N4 adsorption protein A [Ideonella sp.]
RNGQYVEVFARGFATLDARGNTFTGSDSFQGGVGARWKPFTDHNFVVGLSRVFGPNVQDSWLAQAGYSYDYGGELRLDLPSWWTSRFYVEAGKYFGNGTDAGSYGVASATLGRSYIAGESRRTVLYPHLFLGAEHRSRDPSAKTSTGVGVGIGVRHWFREDDKRGPRSYWDVALQYRFRISGDDRMKGPYLSASMSF